MSTNVSSTPERDRDHSKPKRIAVSSASHQGAKLHAIVAAPLPQRAFLAEVSGCSVYTDCYAIDVEAVISQAAFIEAFDTTPLFNIERTLLAWLARKPASDAGARQLACGLAESSSTWHVERQSSEQLLLADMTGHTKSWLMAVSVANHRNGQGTRLHFG